MKINISQEVKKEKKIVAMESTVFSHLGLPFAERQESLQKCKLAVRKAGAVPAITALFDGEIFLGLTEEQETQILAENENEDAKTTPRKMSIRDLPIAMAQKWEIGVTTVSGTLAVASKAGIKVMATGGIGGVHHTKNTESKNTRSDVSADLTALGRYSVGVVCSGAKGFLDLPNTLEALETLGVPVVGYKTDTFSAFWCKSSGLELAFKVDDAKGAAQIVNELEETGAVFSVPVPENMGLNPDEIQDAINSALETAEKKGATGAQATPFILKHIAASTKGKSLSANLALLENNARVAGEIAVLVN